MPERLPSKPERHAAARSNVVPIRALQYIVVIFVIFCALIFLAPYVGSESVRAEAEAPAKVAKQDKHKRNSETFWNGPIPTVEISFDREEWEFLHRDNRRYCTATLTEARKI